MLRYIALLMAVFIIKNSSAQKSKNIELIVDIKGKSFKNADSVFFTIKNPTDRKLFIQISLQKKNNKNWQEVLPDIFKNNSEAILENIILLKSKEITKEFWLPKTFQRNNKIINGEYRFSLKYGQESDKKDLWKNTVSFLLY